MHDPNDAIRRLYGESGEPAPSSPPGSDASADVRAMADMKEALDQLPPRRPDAPVVDAVVAAAAEAAREAALRPVRAAYGEAPLPEGADAETRAFAAMKAGLDALPPQRPDSSLIDAVVAAAGTARQEAGLAAVRTVYGEGEASLPPNAEAEARALAPIKAALDRLPSRRPDPGVIDAVIAAATSSDRPASVAVGTSPAAERAADRPARSSGATARRRVAAVLGTVFALVVVFGGGFWLVQDAPSPESASSDLAVAERPADIAEPEQESRSPAPEAAAPTVASDEARETTGPAPPPARTSAPPSTASEPAARADDLLAASPQRQAVPTLNDESSFVAPDVASGAQAFSARAAADPAESADFALADAEAIAREDDDELRLLYLRLRQLQAAQAGLGWDDPPVALGAAPDSVTTPTGWMQVRVDR